ncbi:MAG: hypothetical protein MJZ45_02820 [Bacteroidales bacterium]|nr:hypothetical protein [Bacteroidales bacterium]
MKDSTNENIKVKNEGGIRTKYSKLINNFIDPDSGMRIVEETDTYICIAMSNTSGQIAFHFQHTFGSINVTMKMNNIFLGKHKLEWDFPENMSQEAMITKIETETRQYMDSVASKLQ